MRGSMKLHNLIESHRLGLITLGLDPRSLSSRACDLPAVTQPPSPLEYNVIAIFTFKNLKDTKHWLEAGSSWNMRHLWEWKPGLRIMGKRDLRSLDLWCHGKAARSAMGPLHLELPCERNKLLSCWSHYFLLVSECNFYLREHRKAE